MKRSLAAALAALVTVTGGLLGSARPAQAGPAVGRGGDDPLPTVRLMPLGDSITVGVGSTTGAGYRLPLWNLILQQSRFRAHFVGSQRGGAFPQPDHEGHSGWTINDIRGKVDGWLATARPDVVLLHIGINDLDRNEDTPHAADRLGHLVDQIYADEPGVTLIVQGLIPTTNGLQDLVQRFNDQARRLQRTERQRGRHFGYVDAPALTSTEFADQLHPNDQGYDRMARTFFGALHRDLTPLWVGGRPLLPSDDDGPVRQRSRTSA
ncbi:SGNH/GDSL hydrolase family protein [Kitasatospora sp. NPDC052896]|uniref:SGNH/GDSL hydrolase family protein n=1 Tax=Kitasatospora sp. NPDC052896 TaxID=3364061 RepID=UPI0037C7FED1